MPVESAFLKPITDNPDDVTARLVYADWLREQDNLALNDRGEFIHLQHDLAMGKVSARDRTSVLARQSGLLETYRDRWEAPFRELIHGSEFRMGFAERVTLSVEQLVDNFEILSSLTPVVRVRLSGLTTQTVEFVANTPSLAKLPELDMNRQPLLPQTLNDLLNSRHLTNLRYLNLARTGIGDEGVRVLVNSPVFPRLRYLNLSHTSLTVDGIHRLVSAMYQQPPSLEVLVLRGAPQVLPRAFGPISASFPHRLRQSLQKQLGLEVARRETTLVELHANRAELSGNLRTWVEWLHKHGARQVAFGATQLPMPDAVLVAFTHVCHRRVLWRVAHFNRLRASWGVEQEHKFERNAKELGIDADTVRTVDAAGLAAVMRLLLDGADVKEKESDALAACLLDLYVRHERGQLPPDGRTR